MELNPGYQSAVEAWQALTNDEQLAVMVEMDDTDGTGYDPECPKCVARRLLSMMRAPAPLYE